ncbi:hypothetical protein VNO78_26106 [Psophocarpus tetragonolobus]|uniref:Uncharacterized protein n=1 Tax=Psophocarpus tetragonolobus TaxID=3891 RepID=A0AAN9RZ50_PSOTE
MVTIGNLAQLLYFSRDFDPGLEEFDESFEAEKRLAELKEDLFGGKRQNEKGVDNGVGASFTGQPLRRGSAQAIQEKDGLVLGMQQLEEGMLEIGMWDLQRQKRSGHSTQNGKEGDKVCDLRKRSAEKMEVYPLSTELNRERERAQIVKDKVGSLIHGLGQASRGLREKATVLEFEKGGMIGVHGEKGKCHIFFLGIN